MTMLLSRNFLKSFGFGKKVKMKKKALIAPPPPVKMTRTISVYIIFAFLLMSFAGCGKLMNIVGLNRTGTSVSLDNFSDDINAKKESWKEWIYRQWNYNKWHWIGGAAVVASGIVDAYVRCYSPDLFPNDYQRNSGAEEEDLSDDSDDGIFANILFVDSVPPVIFFPDFSDNSADDVVIIASSAVDVSDWDFSFEEYYLQDGEMVD
jgi:hypothetical protein